MTIEFRVSRSKVKVTVTFKFRGAYMFYKHFMFYGMLVLGTTPLPILEFIRLEGSELLNE